MLTARKTNKAARGWNHRLVGRPTAIIMAVALTILWSVMAPAYAEQEKIVFEYYTWGNDVQSLEQETYLLSHFTQMYPHIEVNVSLTGSVADHNEKITVMHAAGIAPDIFTISGAGGFTPQFYDAGMVLDLTPYAMRDNFDFDAFLPGAWAYTWRNGKLWSLPRATKGSAYASGVTVYNRKMFNEAGLQYPQQGWTFDDYVETARKLTRSTQGSEPDVWGTEFVRNGWKNVIWSNGGELVDEDRLVTLIDSKEAIEALEWYAQWQTEFGIAGGSVRLHTAAMSPHVSGVGFLRIAPPDLDWAYAEFPKGPRAERSYAIGGANVVAVSSQTLHPEEAWLLLKFLVSEENQEREVFELGTGTAILKSIAFDSRHVYRDGPPYDLTPILLQATKPQPQVPGWAEAEALINNALVPAWLGERSVRLVIEEIVPVVNALLQSAN